MSEKKRKPPLALFVLRLFVERGKATLLESNFEEMYDRIYNQKGRFSAYVWFWF